ncbi:TonB-dependent receptor [Chitinophaga sp. MM2321]|uniref:TonB-dependent receptor n=1 Tax=Chitinophaga sp. MM2321 TaxID=3137178 RepID=UPI0032D58573
MKLNLKKLPFPRGKAAHCYVLLIMKLTTILLLTACLQVSAMADAQSISYSKQHASLEDVFNAIRAQTGYEFLYNYTMISKAKSQDMNFGKTPLIKVLDEIFKDQPLTYTILDKTIVVLERSRHPEKVNANVAAAIAVQGTVTDAENGKPLIGVTIQVKGGSTGTITDESGRFNLSVPNDAVLIVNFIGYDKTEVAVNGRSVIAISLKAIPTLLNQIVVVGYGTQQKANLTGAVVQIEGSELKRTASPNISNAIAGRVAGVIANNRSGLPGDDGSSLSIRGFNTFGGGQGPLVVVDGVADRGLDRIAAEDIESITFLKDASAAIYGVRAANGVILVTTKRGKIGKPVVSYNGSYGLQQLTRMRKLVGSGDYYTYYNEVGTLNTPQSEIDKYYAGNDPLNYPSVDWYKAVFKKNAPQTDHTISVSGGTDQVKYYISGQMLDQGSNFKNSIIKYKQYNVRSNIDARISKQLKVNLDLTARKENRDYPSHDLGGILHEVISAYPSLPDYWPNGLPGPGIDHGLNPAILVGGAPGYEKKEDKNFMSKIGFEWQPSFLLDGLTLSGYGAFDVSTYSGTTLNKKWDNYLYNQATGEFINNRNMTDRSRIGRSESTSFVENYFLKLNYEKKFGVHNVNAFIAYEQNEDKYRSLNAFRYDLVSDKLDQLFAASAVGQQNGGMGAQTARQSVFGRIGYDYNNKYLADFSLRYNGSFNFAPQHRWGYFPALSLSWRISEEDFFKNWTSAFEQLKIRASWALMGNDDVAQYQFFNSYAMGSGGVFFGPDIDPVQQVYLSATENPIITWEKQDTRNVGLDAIFLDGKFSVTADYFRYLRRDILAHRNASIPTYTGLSLPDENIGRSLNRGFDLSATYSSKARDFNYKIGGNITYAKSKILFRDEPKEVPEWQKSEGQPIDAWLIYETNGIYRTQEEVDKSAHLNGAAPGDIWIRDRNGDGSISSEDKIRVPESATPKLVYGITLGASYKNFEFNMLLSGQAKAKQLILPQRQSSVGAPPIWLYEDRYTANNTDAKYPRAFNNADFRNNIDADFWLVDASFLRLKSMEISYNLPKSLLSKVGCAGARFYVSGFNLLSFDNLKKYDLDPETNNVTGNNYPQTRIYKFGVNLDF